MNRVPSFHSIGTQKRFIRGQARLGLLLGSLLLIITTGLFAYMAYAVPLGKPVYGPETFNRGLYFRFFQIAAPTGQYTLTIQNGNLLTGQNRVDSALITLNAKVVVGLRDLTAKTASVEKTVTLNKLNLITVLAVGKKGAFITVKIQGQTANTPPVANAGTDQSAELFSTVTLDGSASSDIDGDLLSYNWNLTNKPTGSFASLTGPNTANPTFTLDKSGTYTGSLVVNDGKANSAPDTVIVSTLNVPPVANAGPNQSAALFSTVTLDGSGSTDVDGNPLTYTWSFISKPAGSIAQLSSATAVKPTFTVDKAGIYVAQLIVNDGKVNSQAAQVTVTTENIPPLANAGLDQSVSRNTLVTLDGSGSTDADHDLLTYAWSFTAKPTGSHATLSGPTAVKPTFTVDLPGTYTLQLIVKDGVVESLADTVVITTLNSRPAANAGPAQTVLLNQLVNLDGLGSTDADNDILTYVWALTTKPPGSTATLLNATSAQPSFTADKPGTYVAQLVVNDGNVDSDPATVTISTLNSKPVANAGPDQTVPFNRLVQLNGTASNDADEDTLTFAWSFTSKPVGSNASLTGNTTAEPGFTGDVAGIYVVELIVNDGKEASAPDTVTITVEPAVPVNVPPTFTSIPVTQATEGEGYSYQAAAIDGNSDALTYALTNNPPQGMAITGTGLITWIPSATQVGDFPVTVTVTDNKSPPVEQSFTITVKAATVTVPNVVGQTQTAAQTAITGANLTVGTITQASSATVPAGNVISQNPAAGATASKNTAVALEVSTGPASGGNLPPDPATVAPPIDPTVATTTFAATHFLYTGTNPIQTGVNQGTIEAKRAAVIRGKVMDKTNAPLSGVTITILNHPEFGQTLSRADGMFDMVVNGGSYLTVNYRRADYLPSQRQINVPWQNFTIVDDVVLTQLDSQVTTIDLNSSVPTQVARGSEVTDADGKRQATLLIPQGTTATMTLADGSIQPLTSLHVRASEYTVGNNGPKSMPAPLPPTSGYTYAVEISADEALAAGALQVSFNQPLPFYVDNFLNFPVGMIVPAGWYDPQKGAWIPSDNGRVIKILSETGVLANVDSNGDGAADNNLGLSDAERQRLALLYDPSKTLWRVPVKHFTPWDLNWPYGPPPGATGPQQPPATGGGDDDIDDPWCANGSVIECENQVVGESISVAGTPFRLHYQSNRVPGYEALRSIDIPLTGSTLPPNIKRIDLELNIAGQRYAQSFTPATNQKTRFVWNGKDAYGNSLKGLQRASVRVGYVYDAVYYVPSEVGNAFSAVSGVPITASRARNELTLWQESWTSASDPLQAGGWSLDVHHIYDVKGSLNLGDGRRRKADAVGSTVISTVAGKGVFGWSGDGGPATSAFLGNPRGIAVGGDGSLYITDSATSRIRKVGTDGIIHIMAGITVNGSTVNGFNGDGQPATSASLYSPSAVAVGDDGSLYIADTYNQRIRRVGTDGLIRTVAGNGVAGFSGDGGPATAASLHYPSDIAVGGDGSLYIADYYNARIRQVGTDGIIRTVAGNGVTGFSGDGGSATAATLRSASDVAVGGDGSLYIADTSNGRIRQVGTDGIIRTVAGNGDYGFSGDGGPATAAALGNIGDVLVGGDGSLYIADYSNARIRQVGTDGIIRTVAGNGATGFSGDGGPATAASFNSPRGVAFGGDGSLYIADTINQRIRRVSRLDAGFSIGDALIASEDSSEVYHFNASGRHLRTLNALTGTVFYQFGYDDQGRMISVTDESGNQTTIQRDALGRITAFVAPFGQRTTLGWDADDHLASATNEAGENYTMTYTANGLLTAFTDPNGHTSTMSYGTDGRLLKDQNAAGGSQSLSRQVLPGSRNYEVSRLTAEGRKTQYRMERLTTGDEQHTVTNPDGTKTSTLTQTNGNIVTTVADGTQITQLLGPDPRFGMQAPVTKSLTNATGVLTSLLQTERTVTLSDQNNPLSLTTLTDTLTLNGRTATSTYNAVTRTTTATSPTGRQTQTIIDSLGRVTESRVTGLEPTKNAYNAKGRLETVTQGTGADQRSLTFSYNTQGYLAGVTDFIGSVTYEYDAAGRVTKQTLADGRDILFGYDANGNLTSLTPPNGQVHVFKYTPVNLTEEYSPPDVGAGSNSTVYEYNLDTQISRISRPDGQTLQYVYDNAGRLKTLTTPLGDTTYGYDATTGKLVGVDAPDGEALTYGFSGALLTQAAWGGTVSGNVGFVYDNDFRVKTVSLNGATPIGYEYDADSLLTKAGSLSLARNAQNGLLTGTTLGSLADSFSHNSFGEVIQYQAAYSGSEFFKVQYIRDKLGRITEKTETILGTDKTYAYEYDLTGRLVTVKLNGIIQTTYGYDANGNRTHLNGQLVGTYDDQDRLLTYNGATYAYNAYGELLSKTSNGQTTQYTYDVLGNLRRVVFPNTLTIDYVIDGQNRRIGKKINGALVQSFLYQDQLKPIAELDGNGNVVSRFVYATHVNVPDYMIKGGNTYRIITDHLGSPRLVVDVATNTVMQRIDYDAWGNVIFDSNPGFQPFGFAGGLYDRDTKLVRFGARDYDAETATWTAKDPILFLGKQNNLYIYASSDPINAFDSNGQVLLFPLLLRLGPFIGLFEFTIDVLWPLLEEGYCLIDETMNRPGSYDYYEYLQYQAKRDAQLWSDYLDSRELIKNGPVLQQYRKRADLREAIPESYANWQRKRQRLDDTFRSHAPRPEELFQENPQIGAPLPSPQRRRLR